MTASVDDYDRFIHPIEDRIIRCIWRIVRNEHDAEDALQDVLARIWNRRKQVFGHPNPTALILRMCANSAYDILRQRLRRGETADSTVPQQQTETPSPLGAMIQEEEQVQVLHAIGRLSRKRAAAVLLRLVDQMPYSQIAAALDCSEITARVHVQRGREELRQRLAHMQPSAER